MSFRELLERYKRGDVTPEEASKVEEEIEKFSALNDYEYQQLENLIGENELSESITDETIEADKISDELFVKKIKKEIKHYFMKVGIAAGCIALAVALFAMFAMPHIVSDFYYDPGKSVENGSKETEWETNQMSLDMAVYSELYMPETPRNSVISEQEGYGKYQIQISNDVWSYDDEPRTTGGRIVRGKLTLYDDNTLKPLGASNVFGWYQRESATLPLTEQDRKEQKQWEKENPGQSGGLLHGRLEREDNKEELERLDDGTYYCAYVTLNKMMGYEAFYKFYQEQGDLMSGCWCAVKTMEPGEAYYFEPSNMGFFLEPTSNVSMNWNKEKYPNLFTSMHDTNGSHSEKVAKAHFTDLIGYMGEQEEFLDMMNGDDTENDMKNKLKQAESYVNKHGITVYGFVARMTKDQALKLLEQEEVYTIDMEN